MKKLEKIQGILFRKKEHKLEFLILKRVASKGDIWQGITGGVEDFDKSLQDACVRELKEELGFTTTTDKVIGPVNQFDFITNRKGYEGQTATEYIFGVELPEDFEPVLNEEHTELKWLPFEEAKELIDFKESKDAVQTLHDKHSN